MALTKVQKEGIETLINNNADNRVITGSGTANTLNGESSVVIDANGKLGVGTTSPAELLHLQSTAGNTKLRLTQSGSTTDAVNGAIHFGNSTDGQLCEIRGYTSGSNNGGYLQFRTTNSGSDVTAMTINTAGNVGIGTTSPSSKLHVKGVGEILRLETTATTGSNYINFNDADENKAFIGLGSGANDNFTIALLKNSSLRFATNSTERMRIDSSGRLLLGTTTEGQANADNLTIDGGDAETGITIRSGTSRGNHIYFSDGTSGDDEYRGIISYQHSDNKMQFFTNAAERMRIDSSGNVGINESSPLAKFHVKVADSGASAYAHCAAVFEDSDHTFIDIMSGTTGSGGINFGDSGSSQRGVVEYDHNSDFMRLIVAGSERMRIDSAGRVSIGTTTNTAHLNVHVNAASRVPQIINDTNNTSTLTHRLRFDTGNTEVGRIRASNTATVYDTSGSDRTLKKNFEDWTENTLDLFKNINPQKFHFIQEEDTAKKSKGFIAQEMVDSFPEAYTKEDKEDSKYFFNPSGMVVYLMKALQEAVAKIEVLETKVAALEAA